MFVVHLLFASLTDLHKRSFTFAAQQGYTPIKDAQDGYSFLSPFGWQEVSVKGQDVVYKDVIEPLESVSVSLTTTDKADITEYGSPVEVSFLTETP